MQTRAQRESASRSHQHHGHSYQGAGFTSVRSTAYLVSMLFTPEIKNPKLRLITRAAIIGGATFIEREMWRRNHEHKDEARALRTNDDAAPRHSHMPLAIEPANFQRGHSAAPHVRPTTMPKTHR